MAMPTKTTCKACFAKVKVPDDANQETAACPRCKMLLFKPFVESRTEAFETVLDQAKSQPAPKVTEPTFVFRSPKETVQVGRVLPVVYPTPDEIPHVVVAKTSLVVFGVVSVTIFAMAALVAVVVGLFGVELF